MVLGLKTVFLRGRRFPRRRQKTGKGATGREENEAEAPPECAICFHSLRLPTSLPCVSSRQRQALHFSLCLSLSLDSLTRLSSSLLSLALQDHVFCGQCLLQYWWSQGLPLEGIACPLCRATAHCLRTPKGKISDSNDRLVGAGIRTYNVVVRFRNTLFALGFATAVSLFYWLNWLLIHPLSVLYHIAIFGVFMSIAGNFRNRSTSPAVPIIRMVHFADRYRL